MMALGKTNLGKKLLIGIASIKQTVYREIFDSPVKIIFDCSLEIMEGSCYVAQVKIPFGIGKKLCLPFVF